MIARNIYENVLMKPIEDGADHLSIVSAWASPSMASEHIYGIAETPKRDISIDLIIGMTPVFGIDSVVHNGFVSLMGSRRGFSCSYIMESYAPVHSNIYIWTRRQEPMIAFAGSADYTQESFYERRADVLIPCDAKTAVDYFNKLIEITVYCTHDAVEECVTIREPLQHGMLLDSGLPQATCALVSNDGEVPAVSGLNWGQRAHRNPNEAYIAVPAAVYRSDFFPEPPAHFTVWTDDGKEFICRRAQDHGKALECPAGNSLIGEYFRNRLGVPSGQPVHTNDLINYGRTSVDFYKVDTYSFYMDFSSPRRVV
jgi:hypothetical protein